MIVPIRFPKSNAQALADHRELDGEYRAGGTDLQERRAHQLEPKALVDLRDLADAERISCRADGAWIGAGSSVQAIAEHPSIRGLWPGLAEASGALATPQIRAVGTLGGNLVQAPRCWYYRHPEHLCLRKGGDTCLAREGDHLWHVCFDTAPCVAPHPSTLAAALLAYEAEVEVEVPGEPPADRRRPLAEVLDVDALPLGALITGVRLPPPLFSERTAYVRASSRAYAEWALVEVCVRLRLDPRGAVDFIRVSVGAVAPAPLRLTAVEDALSGQLPQPARLGQAAALASQGAAPLPMTAYKLELLDGTVLTALERALDAAPTAAALAPSLPSSTSSSSPQPPSQAPSGD